MQAVAGWFAGSAPDKEPAPGASVLSEWKTYTAGAPPASQSGRLLASAEEGAASLTSLVSGALGSAAGAAAAAAAPFSAVPGTTQWVYFAALAGAGLLFLAVAFFLFLPTVIFAPTKFAATFSLGSALVLASLGALRGWRAMAGALLSKERAPFTAAYAASLAGTLYAAVFMHSYVFSLAACGCQIVALVYFVVSYLPGGSAGAGAVFGAGARGAFSVGSFAVRSALNR